MYPLTFYGLTGCALTPTPHNFLPQPPHPPTPTERKRAINASQHFSVDQLCSAVQGACSPHMLPCPPPRPPPSPPLAPGTGNEHEQLRRGEKRGQDAAFPFRHIPLTLQPEQLDVCASVCWCACAQLTPKCHKGGGGGCVCWGMRHLISMVTLPL